MKNWTDEQWCEYIYHVKGTVMSDGYGHKIYLIDEENENGGQHE